MEGVVELLEVAADGRRAEGVDQDDGLPLALVTLAVQRAHVVGGLELGRRVAGQTDLLHALCGGRYRREDMGVQLGERLSHYHRT